MSTTAEAEPGTAKRKAPKKQRTDRARAENRLGQRLVAPAVIGRSAGLELLHPFAISMLAGLLTSIAVALIVVPTCYLVVANRRARSATPAPTPATQTEVK